MLKAHNFVFENKRETMQIMMRWLEQSPEVAERSYELAEFHGAEMVRSPTRLGKANLKNFVRSMKLESPRPP
jgi:hypothetical protein